MLVNVFEYPTERDWLEVKRRALVTVGKVPIKPPDKIWKNRILRARHSPIRRLHFGVLIEDIPYWTSVHLCRHVHAQPYVKSQRNDRQSEYDRNSAPQNESVNMIWDFNAEELMVIANKRLCRLTSSETREVALAICLQIQERCPEFVGLLEPYCRFYGKCLEMYPCGYEQ